MQKKTVRAKIESALASARRTGKTLHIRCQAGPELVFQPDQIGALKKNRFNLVGRTDLYMQFVKYVEVVSVHVV